MRKKHLPKKAALLAAILALGALAGCGSEKKTEVTVIHAGTTGALAPYSYYDENNRLVGYDVELVEAVFEKLPQYKLEWETVEHASIWAGLDSGRYQIGANNYGTNAEREEKYIISDPTMTTSEMVIANKSIDLGSGDKVKFEDLTAYKFVGSSGINHTLLVEDYNIANPDKQIAIEYVENDVQATLTGIETGRYDWTLYNAPFYVGYLKPSFGYDHNYKLLDIDYATYTYALIAKDQTEFAKAFNEALAKVVKEGKAKEISLKYFGGDYAPPVK